MVEVLATNIFSPLGSTSQLNYQAVKSGCCALRTLENWKGVPAKVTAGVFTKAMDFEDMDFEEVDFEKMVISSICEALQHCTIKLSDPRTALIISTTKGDIDYLDSNPQGNYQGPAKTVKRIAEHFGISSEAIIVSNACISGANAQLLAARLIEAGEYDYAIVCGADTVSAFTLAGFLSFKALSPFECRPFDIERLGLNIGEAAATIIFGRCENNVGGHWVLESGAQTNDAYHDSAPLPDGNGLLRAIEAAMDGVGPEDIACVSLHGTATMFNDQMESKAVQNAGLGETAANALKGYFGHTLGAAGLVETIVTMLAMEEGIVLPTRGFEEIGVSGKLSISAEQRQLTGPRTGHQTGPQTGPQTEPQRFIKILSGFGGCNIALRYNKAGNACSLSSNKGQIEVIAEVRLTKDDDIEEIYTAQLSSYPKFHKMDKLAKLAYVASELLHKQKSEPAPEAIILFNGSSSIVQDRKHVQTITGSEGFYPSPSIFLYTLPNIAVGEIAIKQGIKGETALYILQNKDWQQMESIVGASLPKGSTAIIGWIDYSADDCYEADIKLITIK